MEHNSNAIQQTDLINKNKWDIILLLDGCRYDYFKQMHKDILGDIGNLRKVISPALWTFGWVLETFGKKEWKDVVYVSPFPFVNSKGLRMRILDFRKRIHYYKYTFEARKTFKDVIDVWETKDAKKYGTTPPWEINKGALAALKKYPNQRFFIHYGQPHYPHIYYGGGPAVKSVESMKPKKRKINKLDISIKLARFILNDETIWTLSKKFGILPKGGRGELWFKYGKEGLIKGYKEDLKMVMEHAKIIIDKYPNKKIVITADHGEFLGEGGFYGNTGDKRKKENEEIPWFEVTKKP